MTEIGEKFRELLREKAGETISKKLRGKNLIFLRERFDCNVYFLTSSLREGFWGVHPNSISVLKQSKSGRPFVAVFLCSPERGYVISNKILDEYLKDCPQDKSGGYKISEKMLRYKNIPEFKTMDEFINYLLVYRKEDVQGLEKINMTDSGTIKK